MTSAASRGIFYRLQDAGPVDRVVTDAAITEAMDVSRPRPRGPAFGASSSVGPRNERRDFTVDWVHLKLNDQTQRTVLLKDPFRAHDERVERLIESM